MVEIIQNFLKSITYYLRNFEDFLNPFLQRLDPSLFQNIILGVLAIFIPFAIVFLTDILNSKQEKRSEFERMVLNDEVFGTKKVFWLSILGIVFFAFFSGTETPTLAKVIAIIAAIILTLLLWKPFRRILRFSEGYKSEFELPFLKKLRFSRFFRYKNKGMAEKIFRAWNSFWSEKSEFNEKEFTAIFISHIDDAIKYQEFDLAVQLAQTYVSNIEKRDNFLVGYNILPKVFEWNETLWNENQLYLKRYNTEKKIESFFSQKHFPTFRDWVLKLYKELYSKRERFWNWHYFGGDFFKAIIKISLKNNHGSYELFSLFKKFIDEKEKNIDTIKDKKEKEKYWHYMTELFASFCSTFFDEIDKTTLSYSIWEHNFPEEWKIAEATKGNKISHVILHEFLQWSRDRIFEKENKESYDKDLTNVINGIFPNIDSSLFTAFLMLFFSNEVKYALDKEPNFYILSTSVMWSGSAAETEEERDKRIAEMMKAKRNSQKIETIQVILKFFHSWQAMTVYKNDLSKKEFENWSKYEERQRRLIVKRIRTEKLEKIKSELKNDEIKELCKDSEKKELYRIVSLELIELLIKEIRQ